ncbi:hypothetical protein [uncultured Sphingomonas sp.]|nr:hypothetical protein [uncultured Sphingomonas sp.]
MTEATHATDSRLSAAKAPWQAPTAEVLPVSETATGGNTGDDGSGVITGS